MHGKKKRRVTFAVILAYLPVAIKPTVISAANMRFR